MKPDGLKKAIETFSIYSAHESLSLSNDQASSSCDQASSSNDQASSSTSGNPEKGKSKDRKRAASAVLEKEPVKLQ